MKKYLLLLALSILIAGCCPVKENKAVLAKINNYEITQEEFEAEFKDSSYALTDTPEARAEFLENLINRKLILQDAQRKGLDKKQGFLKLIEKFWEQSLLKVALDKKTQEVRASISVSDKESRYKEEQAINTWIEQLRKNAQIKINKELLK